MTAHLIKGSLAATALALVLAAPAHAQNAAEESGGLGEIVVTAQKRSENLQDVPIAVSALSGETLTTTGIDTQVNLPRLTPGLTLNMGAGFSTPYIRGIGTTFATLGLESSVATYFDDQYISRPLAGFFSFNDIERVEVLKGPQGTLYGRNAAAGAIRIITRDPTQDFSAEAAASYGSFDRIGVEGVLNLPLSSTLSARVSGSYETRDSYIKTNDPDGGPGRRKEALLRGKLLWEPTSNFSAKLTLDYARVRDPEAVAFILIDQTAPTSVGIVRGAAPSPGFYTSIGDYGPGSSLPNNVTKTFGAQFRMDLDLGKLTLSSISGYRWTDLDEQGEQDATQVPYSHFRFAERSRAYSQELQAILADGPLRIVGGAYYYYEKGSNAYESFGQTLNDSLGVPYRPTIGSNVDNPVYAVLGRASTEAFAPYAEATYEFSPQLSLTLGARYTWESKTLIENRNLIRGLGPDIPVFTERDVTFKFSQFTPKATLSYKPNDDVLLYLTYGRGFKSGGLALPSTSAALKVDPEILDSYEFGWKTEFGSFRLNGAAFYYDFKDLQVQRPDQGGALRLENAANARILGAEIEALLAVNDAFEIGLGASYLDTKYKGYQGTANVPANTTAACAAAGGASAPPYPAACIGYASVSADFSGRSMVNAPKFTAYGRMQYRVPGEVAGGKVRIDGLVNYTGRYFYNPEHSLSEPSKVLMSGSITWQADAGLTLSVFGDNLLGEKYDIYKTIIVNPASYRIPGAPRSWGVRIGYAF